MLNEKLPINLPAIQIEQPLGTFYVTRISAELLLQITYSTPATAKKSTSSLLYNIFGSQRDEKVKRLKEIAEYIDTVDAAFPNSIILGANYDEFGDHVTDPTRQWTVKDSGDGFHHIIIPSIERVASLIDGQHRLHAFEFATKNLNMPLLCAVYLDIPLPYHAYIFATINFNQKKVDRSLAYDLFGFNLDEGASSTWAPETLAVYITRLLNAENDSPFYDHIKLGVKDNLEGQASNWQISMATIVDGLLSLISSHPKKDRYLMHRKSVKLGRSRKDLLERPDTSPLREIYIAGNDKGVYQILFNYFIVSDELYWRKSPDNSYIKKTVGIQALFDVLKTILNMESVSSLHKFTSDYFHNELSKSEHVDFTNNFFQASGTGRGRIKNVFLVCLGLKKIEELKVSNKDRQEYLAICSK